MTAHAVYAPSSAHRWMVCTASAEAISRLPPQEEGEEAKAGTEAHEEIERCLYVANAEEEYEVPRPVDPNHPAAYGVGLVIDFVRQLLAADRLGTGRLWVEQRVRLTDQIWGRCDVAHWSESDAVLTIVDYKNGYVDVAVQEADGSPNTQEGIYAGATILTHQLPAKWVRLVIVQPNSFMPVPRVKQAIFPASEIRALVERAAAVPTGPLTFTAGEQCKYCPMFGKCPASQDVLRSLSAAVCASPEDVPADQRAIFKAMEKPLTDWFKSADKAWTKDALRGQVPAGMKLVQTTTKRAWKSEAEARRAVLERFGPDKLDPPTPAQAEKLGMDVSALAVAPPGGPALAFESDKRPAWAPVSVKEMFRAAVEHEASKAS